jgi:hypothetical protein
MHSYIVVRRDLTPSQQAVQAAHAAMEMGFKTQAPASPTHIVLLGVKDQAELL